MKPELFVFFSLVNKNLREGSLLHRRAYGTQTSYWKMLESLVPEKMPDGTYRGDAGYFLARAVQPPLQKFQGVLRYYRDGVNCQPLPGEALITSYVPRLVLAVTAALQERGRLTTDTVEMTPENINMLTIMDTYQMKQVIISAFNLGDMPAELQDDLIATIGELVVQGLLIQATDAMDEAQLAEFEKISEESQDPDEIMSYIEAFIPDFDGAVVAEVARIQAEMNEVEG